MTAAAPIVHLALGPPEHGVVQHALHLAAAAGEAVVQAFSAPDAAELVGLLSQVGLLSNDATCRLLHLHVTDRLCGSTPERAADLVEAVAARYQLSITLHDLPQASDGPDGFRRRRDAYRRMAHVARRVLVSSHHEAALMREVAPDVRVQVVPLPVPTRPHRSGSPLGDRARTGPATVGVLGYLYPGKGHAEVLSALDATDHHEVGLAALGRPSDGHDWLVEDLRRRAGHRPLEITGYLDDDDLDRRIAEVTVPVVAPTHVSASGSLHRWIGCGRRPVVLDSPYTREVAEHLPGTMLLTDDLPAALDHALRHPQSTWLIDHRPGWSVDDAAAAQTTALLQDRS